MAIRRSRFPAGFGALWGCVLLDLIGFGIVLPILPLWAERFGARPGTIGALVATYSAFQLVCAPLWGRLSDRVGRKPVLVLSLLGTAAGSLLTGLASSLVLLFVGRAIDGMSGASVAVAQAAVTDLAEPSERPRLLGLIGAAFGLGFVAGPALGSLVAFSAFEATFSLFGERRLGLRLASTGAVFAGIGLAVVLANAGLVAPAVRRLGEQGALRLGLVLDGAGLVLLAVTRSWAVLVPALLALCAGQGLVTPTLSSSL